MSKLGNILDWFNDFFSKWWVYLFYILIGIVGKFSWEISRRRRITWMGAISTVGLSGFIGYLSTMYCLKNGLKDQAAYIVPICTLLSDKILTYIIVRIRWKEIRNAIFNIDKP